MVILSPIIVKNVSGILRTETVHKVANVVTKLGFSLLYHQILSHVVLSALVAGLYATICYQERNLISKHNISKNMKMELTLDTYIKFNLESVPGVHSSQNEFEFCKQGLNFDPSTRVTKK